MNCNWTWLSKSLGCNLLRIRGRHCQNQIIKICIIMIENYQALLLVKKISKNREWYPFTSTIKGMHMENKMIIIWWERNYCSCRKRNLSKKEINHTFCVQLIQYRVSTNGFLFYWVQFRHISSFESPMQMTPQCQFAKMSLLFFTVTKATLQSPMSVCHKNSS